MMTKARSRCCSTTARSMRACQRHKADTLFADKHHELVADILLSIRACDKSKWLTIEQLARFSRTRERNLSIELCAHDNVPSLTQQSCTQSCREYEARSTVPDVSRADIAFVVVRGDRSLLVSRPPTTPTVPRGYFASFPLEYRIAMATSVRFLSPVAVQAPPQAAHTISIPPRSIVRQPTIPSPSKGVGTTQRQKQ